MVRVAEREDIGALQVYHILGQWHDSGDGCIVERFNGFFYLVGVVAGQGFIDNQIQRGNIQAAGDVYRYGRSLEILLVGPQDNNQNVREGNREQRFFVQPRMGIDEELVEGQRFADGLQPGVKSVDIITITDNLADITAVYARGNQPQIFTNQLLATFGVTNIVSDVKGDLFNRTIAVQKFVQGPPHLFFVQAE
jgi:hypothetical protein